MRTSRPLALGRGRGEWGKARLNPYPPPRDDRSGVISGGGRGTRPPEAETPQGATPRAPRRGAGAAKRQAGGNRWGEAARCVEGERAPQREQGGSEPDRAQRAEASDRASKGAAERSARRKATRTLRADGAANKSERHGARGRKRGDADAAAGAGAQPEPHRSAAGGDKGAREKAPVGLFRARRKEAPARSDSAHTDDVPRGRRKPSPWGTRLPKRHPLAGWRKGSQSADPKGFARQGCEALCLTFTQQKPP